MFLICSDCRLLMVYELSLVANYEMQYLFRIPKTNSESMPGVHHSHLLKLLRKLEPRILNGFGVDEEELYLH